MTFGPYSTIKQLVSCINMFTLKDVTSNKIGYKELIFTCKGSMRKIFNNLSVMLASNEERKCLKQIYI